MSVFDYFAEFAADKPSAQLVVDMAKLPKNIAVAVKILITALAKDLVTSTQITELVDQTTTLIAAEIKQLNCSS